MKKRSSMLILALPEPGKVLKTPKLIKKGHRFTPWEVNFLNVAKGIEITNKTLDSGKMAFCTQYSPSRNLSGYFPSLRHLSGLYVPNTTVLMFSVTNAEASVIECCTGNFNEFTISSFAIEMFGPLFVYTNKPHLIWVSWEAEVIGIVKGKYISD